MRDGEKDHRSLLIHSDYKVRLRLSDMAKSCLSFFLFLLCLPALSPHLKVSGDSYWLCDSA